MANPVTRFCAAVKGATYHGVMKACRRAPCIAQGAKDGKRDFERRAPTREHEEGGKERLRRYGIPYEGPPAQHRNGAGIPFFTNMSAKGRTETRVEPGKQLNTPPADKNTKSTISSDGRTFPQKMSARTTPNEIPALA